MIGVVAAALRAGWVLFLLHQAYTIGSAMLPAPQAKLMATLADGRHARPAAVGACSASAPSSRSIAELAGIASLPFAIGLYLPITTTASLIFGGLAEWRLDRGAQASERRERLPFSPPASSPATR